METDKSKKKGKNRRVTSSLSPAVMRWQVKEAQRLYCMHKRIYMNQQGLGTYRPNWSSLSRQTDWTKVVRFFVEHGLNINRCLAVRFNIAARSARDSVFPNTIAIEKYLGAYQEACDNLVQELAIDLNTQKQICRVRILSASPLVGRTSKEITKHVLLDETVSLSPLFRYCLAKSEDLRGVAKRYGKKALNQYLLSMDDYDVAWGIWIPEVLQRKAREIIGE